MKQHPLDSVFGINSPDHIDIESQYDMTEVPAQSVVSSSSPQEDIKDEDDVLIEKRIDEVYDEAIEAFRKQNEYTEIIEPRYAARNAEVAANYLNIALAAANSRSKVKVDRKRANQVFVPHGNNGKNTTNVLIASREEILKMIDVDKDGKKEV